MVQFRRPPLQLRAYPIPQTSLSTSCKTNYQPRPSLTFTSGQGSAEVKSQGNALQRCQALAPADLEVTASLIDSGIHTIYQSIVWNLNQYIPAGSNRFQR